MPKFKFLPILMLGFVLVLLMANWFDARLVQLFGFINTDAGTLIFPFTFIIGGIITEVYGFKYARVTIWLAFICNFLFLLYGQLVIHLPSPHYALARNHGFDQLLHAEARIIIASFIAYFVAEPLDTYLVAKTKVWLKGRLMALRFFTATFIASFVGSILFGIIAFWGVMSDSNLLLLIITMWLIKVAIEVIFLPLSVWTATRLKRVEQCDIYDSRTNFSLLKLDIQYTRPDNQFKGKP